MKKWKHYHHATPKYFHEYLKRSGLYIHMKLAQWNVLEKTPDCLQTIFLQVSVD